MELDRHGAELLFQVLSGREEKDSLAIFSNEGFAGWTEMFTDPRHCAAIVDRRTFGENIIETGSASYRLEQTRARNGHRITNHGFLGQVGADLEDAHPLPPTGRGVGG